MIGAGDPRQEEHLGCRRQSAHEAGGLGATGADDEVVEQHDVGAVFDRRVDGRLARRRLDRNEFEVRLERQRQDEGVDEQALAVGHEDRNRGVRHVAPAPAP